MTDVEIINAGYKEYKPTPFHSEAVTKCFQKRFDDDYGKKYFIDINKWEFPPHPHTGELMPVSYEFGAQIEFNDKPINFTLFSGWEIEDAEKWVEDMWQNMNGDYYEKWDDC